MKRTKLILIIITTVILYNCTHDEVNIKDVNVTTKNTPPKIEAKKINAQKVPILMDFLKENISKSVIYNDKGDFILTNFGYISLNGITQVTDFEKHISYTLPIIPNNKNNNSFYKLIVIHNPDVSEIESFVLEYNMLSHLPSSYNKNVVTQNSYSGYVKNHHTEDFFSVSNATLLKTPSTIQKTSTYNEESPQNNNEINQSSIKCDNLGLYIIGCGGTNSNRNHLFSTCNGPEKSINKAFYLFDCKKQGEIFPYEDPNKPKCTECPEDPEESRPAASGGGTGGTTEDSTQLPYNPQYECVKKDPITKECTELVRYYGIIDMPANDDDDDINIETNEL